MATNDRPRPTPRARPRQESSQRYSFSDGEDMTGETRENYHQREQINNLNAGGLGLTVDESTISPIETLDPSVNRLYSYDLSGSEGDVETDNPASSAGNWERRQSHSSLSSEENNVVIPNHVTPLLADTEERHYEEPWPSNVIDFTEAPTLPRPPPVPPPFEGSNPSTRNRNTAYGPQGRPAHQYTEIDPYPPSVRRENGELETYYLVQTPAGNVFVPNSVHNKNLLQQRNVQTLLSGEASSPQCNSNTNHSVRTGTNGDAVSLRYNSVYGSSNHNTPAVPLPTTFTPVHNDFRPYNKLSNAGHRMKKHIRNKCTWKCTALIFIVLSLVLLVCVAYLAAIQLLNLQWNLQDKTHSVLGSGQNETAKGTKIDLVSFSTGAPHSTSTSISYTTAQLNQPMEDLVPAKESVTMQLDIPEPKFVKFNFSLPDNAIIGVYGRKNSPPSYVQFDFYHVLDGNKIVERRKREVGKDKDRSSENNVVKDTAFIEYLESGIWFVMVYNDDQKANTIEVVSTSHEQLDGSCPKDCHGRGDCQRGQCVCFPGFTGWDCSQDACPVLCSGKGIYVRGKCQCFDGFKGTECNVPIYECEVPNCNGNGVCVDGNCVCATGFKGSACSEVDCIVRNCSGNGVCFDGKCYCKDGFMGLDCSLPEVNNVTNTCRQNCSHHGVYDTEIDRCKCEEGWSGKYCEIAHFRKCPRKHRNNIKRPEICTLDCNHGVCEQQRCVCDAGWTGASCDQLQCDHRCTAHGFCDNGTCICNPGWNGKYCSLDGCPRSCSNHGQCQKFPRGWACNCLDGWKGEDCGLSMEMQCSDGVDNDRDGLPDCQDPDCCISVQCKENMHCNTSPDPLEILLRKQPPSTTASFFDKMRFLIEEDSVQKFAVANSFNESQVSVIRGSVQSSDGTSLIGVRVSVVTQPLYGFTLTREAGMFDILVNGGGSVVLQFQRQPFKTKTASVIVPWNQIVTMDTVSMVLEGSDDVEEQGLQCAVQQDPHSLKPLVLSTWQHTQLGSCPSESAIIPESQVVQESLQITGTSLYLVYHSSKTSGYMSSILIQLTPNTIPPTLSLVHLKVSVEGLMLEKLFEADASLKYRFAWDRTNAYKQKVYGIVTATVRVGYQFQDCEYVFWETQTATMSGYDLTSSEIGGWNLDIHHTYNFQEGILHKGDGTNIYLKEKPKRLTTILGNGRRRRPDCASCDGDSADVRLLAPVALASGRDGSLYVGDYNFIRKLSPDRRTTHRILQLSAGIAEYKYYMTVSPLDGKLYISDPHKHQIIRIKTMGAVRNLEYNYEVIAGNQNQQCVPGDSDQCGDGGLAVDARLVHPKGIAINKDGLIFFVDGVNIRQINSTGHISTILGSQLQPGEWEPLPCQATAYVTQVKLRWPTALSVNPLDDTLHILDNNMVLQLTKEMKIKVVAGHPPHCPREDDTKTGLGLLSDDKLKHSDATQVSLTNPQNFAFGPNGEMFIAETDLHYINRIRKVSTSGLISHYVGARAKCDCQKEECKCYDSKEILASSALLHNPSAVTVTPDNVLHIADMGNLRVHSVISMLPVASRYRQYEVLSPETQERYIFNRYGQHLYTKNIMTDQYIYNFTYSVNSYYGKLVRIAMLGNSQLRISRDYNTWAREIVSPTGERCKVKMNPMGQLESFTTIDNYTTTFTYISSTGLLFTKQSSSGHTYFYDYDDNGRLARVVQPTGEVMQVDTDVQSTGAVVTVAMDTRDVVTMATLGNRLWYLHESGENVNSSKISNVKSNISYSNDGSLVVEYPNNLAVTMETATHPLLDIGHRLQVKRKIIGPDNRIHRLEWRYYLRREGKSRRSKKVEKIGRRLRVGSRRSRHGKHGLPPDGNRFKILRVNGEHIFTIEYDRNSNTEMVMDPEWNPLLTVVYSTLGLPIFFQPASSELKPVNITTDAQGRVTRWQRGEMFDRWDYNAHGQLNKQVAANGATYMWLYKTGNQPVEVSLPSGKQYKFHYDYNGNLISVVTPNGGSHGFNRMASIGFHRFYYTLPGQRYHYIQDYTSDGRLLRIQYPSDLKRVYYFYDKLDKLSEIIFGKSSVQYFYQPSSGLLERVNVTSPKYSCQMEYMPSSSFASKVEVKFTDVNFAGAKFQYTYDNNFRVNSLDAQIGTNKLRPTNYTYNDTSGRLEILKAFTFNYVSLRKQLIRDINVEITKQNDEYNRLTNMIYKFNNMVVYSLELKYDTAGRLKQWRRLIGRSDSKTFEYIYDIDNNVLDVLLEGQSSWTYTYDANGNLATVTKYGRLKEMLTDNKDRIVNFGDTTYLFDTDGFLIQRNQEMFEYNSKGQLVLVTNGNQRNIWYYYDPLDRLVARKDSNGEILQLFYGNIQKPNLVTHSYNQSSGDITTYYYDVNGRLLSMERKDRYFYIASDPSGSPVAIYDSLGNVIKQISYEPFGHKEIDSPQNFEFIFGYQGNFHDPATGLVHFGTRVYDPVIGRYMMPDFSAAFESFPVKAQNTPHVMNPYQMLNPISLKFVQDRVIMTGIFEWMQSLGFDLKSLIPSVSFEGQIRDATPKLSNHHLLPVMSVFECAFERDADNFLHMPIVPKSKLLISRQSEKQNMISPLQNILGDGVVVSLVAGYIKISHLDTVGHSASNQFAIPLLNNSQVLDFSFTVHGRVTHYFVKEDYSLAESEIAASGLSEDFTQLPNGINITIDREGDISNTVVIQLLTEFSKININYGTTVAVEKMRVLRHAKERAVQHAWAQERHLLLSNQAGTRHWTADETADIVQSGKAGGYIGEYRRDVNEYTYLADDPANIKFVSL